MRRCRSSLKPVLRALRPYNRRIHLTPETRMPHSDKFTIGLIQMSCTADTHANLEKAVSRIREAARAGANVICTQELFRSQYFCQKEDPGAFDLAEEIPGPTTHT